MTHRSAIACLVVSLSLAAQPEATSPESTCVRALQELATWCFESKLYRERDRLYALVLRLDPEHAGARGALRYRKDRDGRWIQKDYREPKNRDATLEPECARRRDAILGRYVEASLAPVAELEAASPIRRATLARLLEIAPEDPRVQAALGHVKLGETWVLPETVAARARRPDLLDLGRASVAAVGSPEKLLPPEGDDAHGLSWTGAFRTRDVRAYGTGHPLEPREVARKGDAAGRLFRTLFRETTEIRPDLRFWVLTRPGEKATFLGSHPRITEDERAAVEKLSGAWIPGVTEYVEWSEDARTRLDSAVRQTLGTLLMDTYGINGEHGWAWEGFGIYCGYLVTGTRLSWFVERPDYDDRDAGLMKRLKDPKSDWLRAAWRLVESRSQPALRGLLTRSVNALSHRDMVMAHGLAAYLLEARPTDAVSLLRACGAGVPAPEAVERTLGLPLDLFELRFHRWLREADHAR